MTADTIPIINFAGVDMEMVVFNLTGKTGSGKTKILDDVRSFFPNSIQIIEPSTHGEIFDPSVVDWDQFSALAIDELAVWDRPSLRDAIRELESFARRNNKKLILVSQSEDQLIDLGVKFSTQVFVLTLKRIQA